MISCGFSKNSNYQAYLFFNNDLKVKDTVTKQNLIYSDTLSKLKIFEKSKGAKKVIVFINELDSMKKTKSIYYENLVKEIKIDSYDKKKFSFYSIFKNYFLDGFKNNLYARNKLARAPLVSEGKNNIKFQLLSTINSFFSNNVQYDSLISTYEKTRKLENNPLINDLINKSDVYIDDNVINKIGKIALNNAVIMLNEDHYYPKHRLFALKLLNTLHQNGFKYLSLEAFDTSKKIDFIPNNDTGTYTSEPFYAHLIREAKALGFIILGHEDLIRKGDRELGQAQNIIKIIEKDPDAKIFVYVGHSHIEKNDIKKKWMAQYFKELSNINPITINQVAFCADIKNNLMLVPQIYFNDTTKTKSKADYFLINNLKPNLKEIFKNTIFKNIKITDNIFLNYKKEEVLIEVYYNEEYNLINEYAVPIESYLSTTDDNSFLLKLPKGKYKVLVKSVENKVIYDKVLIVD